MSTLMGSPMRSNKNAFLERYVQKISPEKSPLTKTSPSKVNCSHSLGNQLKSSDTYSTAENKENSLSEFSVKLGKNPFFAPSEQSNRVLRSSPSTSTISNGNTFDCASLSKDENCYYEFLCRVGEVKKWIENVIELTLPSEMDLCVGDGLRNGVYLAMLTQKINPELAPTVFPAGNRLQFKHTQNINAFFSLVDHVGLPESFRFELQDLYNKKDLPQVFETLYILITIINKKWPLKTPLLESLSGKLIFSKEELRKCQRTWPRIRDFKSLSVSPVASPMAKRTNAQNRGGLINDFKKYDESKADDDMIPQTPEDKLETPQLSPPSQTRALFSLPPSTEHVNRGSPSRFPSFKTVDEEILSRTPHLEYSPIKNSSLSYYSPSISKYLTYDTDFYMRRSHAREKDLDYYQSYKYGPIDYSPKKRQKMTEMEFLESVMRIQGICRAVNVRFQFHIQRNLLKLFEREVLQLQSLIRSYCLRRTPALRRLVSLTSECEFELIGIQGILRGSSTRLSFDRLRIKILRQDKTLEDLQRFCHGLVVRRKAQSLLCDITQSKIPLMIFQALIKGIRQRSMFRGGKKFLPSDLSGVMGLQSLCRGFLLRKPQAQLFESFDPAITFSICAFQNKLRGVILRSSLSNLRSSIEDQNLIISKFCARLKGTIKRKSMADMSSDDYEQHACLLHLQAIVRGVLVRYTLDLVDNIIEYNHLAELQARLHGYVDRSKLDQRSSFFQRNLRSIIAVQSKIRMHLQRRAYVDLMQFPNPTLWSVRKFSHLLNDIGTIEETQNKLEKCQAQLDSENLQKDQLEKNIRQELDMLEVLEKYELLSDYPHELNGIVIPKRRFPTFEKLFYLLQVDPSYWKLMYSKDPKFVEHNVYVTFSTVNQKMGEREKRLFTRLFVELIQFEISESNSVSDFLKRRDTTWIRLLKSFLQREYPDLFALFLPIIKFLADPKVQFESNPSTIFKQIHGVKAQNNILAVEDAKTSAKFVENLRNLWHSIELISMLFSKRVMDIPLELRFICTKIFCSAADKNATETDTMSAISMVLVKCLTAEFLQNRSYYGFSEIQRNGLDEKIDTMLNAMMILFSGGRFTDYYEPLNAYAEQISPQVKDLLFNVLLDPTYEQDGDRLVYDDMISKTPQLEILTEKVLKISLKFQESISFFPDEDAINEILQKGIGKTAVPSTGRVMLDLNPTAYRFLASDDRTRKLYDQVKRAFIYMTQVEEINTNLYDLALSCVLPQDEPNFKRLLIENPKIKSDPMLLTFSSSSYFDLKNETLKKIHELEHMGIINPTGNKLQNFLNDIANTIKNPHYAIDYVTQELSVTMQTVSQLSKINLELQGVLRRFKKSIDHALKDIQQSRSFAPTHKSTLGNLKGAYKKVQHKKGVELKGLKFKWTTRQLYEKGVIKTIEGERLAEQKVKVFGSSGPRFPDINFKISTGDGSKFGIQMLDRRKGPERRHSDAVDSFDLKELLKTQVGSKVETLNLFNDKVAFSTSALLKLVVSAFLKNEHQM